jgi:hypothetical protein
MLLAGTAGCVVQSKVEVLCSTPRTCSAHFGCLISNGLASGSRKTREMEASLATRADRWIPGTGVGKNDKLTSRT